MHVASATFDFSLLYCLSGVLRPDEGQVWYQGERIDGCNAEQRAILRRRSFGFAMQFGLLVPELSLMENVALPMRLNGKTRVEAHRSVMQWLDRLGIGQVAE